jgi:hypothetical protein
VVISSCPGVDSPMGENFFRFNDICAFGGTVDSEMRVGPRESEFLII